MAIKMQPVFRRAGEVADITGISTAMQRDLQRRGYPVGDDSHGWRSFSPRDLAKLFFVKVLRDARIELSEAWRLASDEIVGNILLHALIDHRERSISVCDGGQVLLDKHLNRWAMNIAAVDGKHVGAGDYFVFGPNITAGQFTSIDEAMAASNRSNEGPHLVIHVVALREVSRALVERANELATVRDF